MSVAAEPVRLDFNDYIRYTETHPESAFKLLDGAIFTLAPEGDAHLRKRSAIDWLLNRRLDLARYSPWTEASFPAAGWFDGPRPQPTSTCSSPLNPDHISGCGVINAPPEKPPPPRRSFASRGLLPVLTGTSGAEG